MCPHTHTHSIFFKPKRIKGVPAPLSNKFPQYLLLSNHNISGWVYVREKVDRGDRTVSRPILAFEEGLLRF